MTWCVYHCEGSGSGIINISSNSQMAKLEFQSVQMANDSQEGRYGSFLARMKADDSLDMCCMGLGITVSVAPFS